MKNHISNQCIFLISQQSWGEMFVSKHHYAVQLSKQNNQVFFLNPPDQQGILSPGEIQIEKSPYEGLKIIHHRLFFPYKMKFHLSSLYVFGMRLHIKRMIQKLNINPTIIWSFDLSDTIPLQAFPKVAKRIFMPVDRSYGAMTMRAAKAADYLVVITTENELAFSKLHKPLLKITHGVEPAFIHQPIPFQKNGNIHIGMSGNFTRPDIDWSTLIKIVEANKDVIFECWGSFRSKGSNLAGSELDDPDMIQKSDYLASLPNFRIHGNIPSNQLPNALKEMDGFLICYDPSKDFTGGSNYHKILEYLGTGKVIISNRGESYRNTGLLEMAMKTDNTDLPEKFKTVINNIESYNEMNLQMKRTEYAKNNTYERQLEKIATFIN